MAKKVAKSGTFTKSRQNNYTTKWLKNAMKSMGMSTSEVIKDIAPNIYEISSSGINTSKNVVMSMRRNKESINKVGDALNSNRYVRFAQTAYKNAMTDIKSGNFNNTERMSQSMTGLGDDSESSGFTFGDDGADDSSNVNVNINSSGNDEAMMNFGNQLQTQATAQMKTQKASMDAYIAVSAAGMQQSGQLGADIINQLTNVNNNLSAIIEYNNSNVTKFIEASLAYYDKSGSKLEGSNGTLADGKVSAKDVMNTSAGGLNIGRYKGYVKQQFKDMVEHSNVGLLKSLADDDTMMDMLSSNPMFFLTKGLSGYLMPKVLTTSLEAMETTFSNFMPNLLSQLADLADTEGTGALNSLKRTIGKTFGLKNERVNSIGGAKVERGPIPFDNETKHAITEIITKELREQTGYLEIIANHYDKDAKTKAKNGGEYWSWGSNAYINKKDIDTDIADQIVSAITSSFNDSKFGKSMENLVSQQKGSRAQKEMKFSVEELFMEIERSGKHIGMSDLMDIIDRCGSANGTKKIIKDYVRQMSQNDSSAFHNLNTARLRSQADANEIKNQIMENPNDYNLQSSSFYGADTKVDDVIDKIKGYKDRKGRNRRMTKGTVEKNDPLAPVMAYIEDGDMSGIKNGIKNTASKSISIMNTIMRGNASDVLTEGAGYIVEGMQKIGSKIKDYADNEDGILFEVKQNFKNIGTEIKDGVMLKLFGRVKDADGKYVKDEEGKGGAFGQIGNVFKKGIDSWTDVFFGTDQSSDPEQARKTQQSKILESLKGALPNAVTGSAIGAGVGMLSGGSLLGMLVGGPLGGAAIGAATGFLSKNEKFQKLLFGEKDDDGNRLGGIISKKTQEYFKDNKTLLAGCATFGAVGGAISGGGILGTLVGGPIAGSMMAMAGGVVGRSEMFQRFLFGDEEKGQKGLINGIRDAWSRNFEKGDKTGDGAKLLGMSAVSTATGGILGALVGGPVVGAIGGLALAIKAQSGNFKEWLFGKEDGLTLDGGEKAKKQGIVGIIGNTINANILKPMKTEIKFIGKDFMSTLQHKVLSPFAFAAEAASGKLGEIASKVTNGAESAFKTMGDTIKNTAKELFSPITNAVGKSMKKATDFTWGIMKKVMSTPGALVKATLKTLDLKKRFNALKPVKWIKGFAKDVRKLIFAGIKTTFKGILGVATAPFKLLGAGLKKIWGGTKFLANKALNNSAVAGVKNKISNSKFVENFRMYREGVGDSEDSLIQRMNRDSKEYKEEQKRIKEERKNDRRHDKNAKEILKLTNGQFSEDSDEARAWIRRHNRRGLKRLEGDSITSEKEAAEIAKNGKGTAGMTTDELGKTSIDKLNEQGKQTKLQYQMSRGIDTIVQYLQGKNISKFENDDERNARESQEKEDELEKDKKLSEEAAKKREQDEKDKEDHESRQAELDDVFGGNQENGLVGIDKFKYKTKKMIGNVKNYFKNDFFSNTRQNVNDDIINGSKTKSDDFVTKITNGKFKTDSQDARKWMMTNRPDMYAKFMSKIVGQPIQSRAIGGFVKKGLSLIGEKGAELVKMRGGEEVLDADKTEDVLNDVSESQSDEKRKSHKLRNWLRKGRAKTKEERDKASEDATIINQEELLDLSSDSKKKALDNAKTASELKKEREEEKWRDEQKAHNAAMLAATKEGAENTKKFSLDWSKIFSKKGLVTAAAITGFLWLKKNLPGFVNTVGSILSAVLGMGGDALKDLGEQATFTNEHAARTDGNTASEQLQKNIDDIKDGNILTDADGNSTHQTDSRARFLARRGMNFYWSNQHMPFENKYAKMEKGVYNGAKAIGNGAKTLGKGVANYAKDTAALSELYGKYGDEALELASGPIQKAGAKLGQTKGAQAIGKGLNKAKNIAGAGVEALKNKAKGSKTGGLFKKVSDYVVSFFKMITKKLSEKSGKKIGESIFKKINPKKIINILKTHWDDLALKISTKLGVKGGAAAVSFGISEAIFATLGAINGVSGTAKLFQVDSKSVDGTMRIISGILGTIAGTTVGSVVDIVFSLVGDIIGVDIVRSIAVAMYNAIVGRDSDKAKNLKDAQSSWQDAYLDDRDKQLEKQWKTQKKAGIIGEDVTYDDFVAGVEDGTYSAEYKSFQDWNAQKNKSLGDHIASGAGKAWKGTKKGVKALGSFLFGKKETTYTDAKGNTYVKNDNGGYDVKDASGNDIGSIAKDALPKDVTKETTKKKGFFSKAGKGIVKGSKAIGNAAVKGIKALGKGIKGLGTKAKDTIKQTGKLFKWLTEKETTVGYLSADGTYYDAEGQHYNANGDKLDKIGLAELSDMITSGQLTETEITTKERGITQLMKKTKETLKKNWTTAVTNTKKFFTNMGKGITKGFNKLVGVGKNTVKNINNFFKGHKDKVWFATDGSYYDSKGQHYTANGDMLDKIEIDDLTEMVKAGELTEGEANVNSGLKTTINTIGTKIKDGWNKATTGLSNFADGVKKKATKLFKKFGKGISNGFTKGKNFLLDHKETRWHSAEGGYYQSNGTTFDYYNESGNLISTGISQEEFNDLCKTGVVSADDSEQVNVSSGLKTKFKEIGSKIAGTFNSVITKQKAMWNKVKKTGTAIFDEVKKKGIGGFIGGLFKSEKSMVWYDPEGNYYKLESDGTYSKYNINGDVIKDKIEASSIESMQSAGLLTKGEIIKDSKAKKAVNSIKKSVEEAWDKAKTTVKSGWDKFKNWIGGGSGAGDTVAEFADNEQSSQGGSGNGVRNIKKSVRGGGFGTDKLNGGTYYSQNDSRWGNDDYNMGRDDAKMADSGCGPTAMAMAASDATGKKIDPTQMASLAKVTGNRDNTGTNWNFINEASGALGLGTKQEIKPSAQDISDDLDSGNPVILSGTGGSGEDPYTKAGHYVVATGKDKNGNILVNDPRGRQYSKKYNINDVANKTGSSWVLSGRGGFGKKKKDKQNLSTGDSADISKWISIVQATKKAIAAKQPGYSQSNWIKITVGGKTLSVRTDCSGFVAACLKFFGVAADGTNFWSGSFLNGGDAGAKKTGFKSGGWPGWDGLKEGDIIANGSHVEIFCRNDGGQHYVYNCGSTPSVNNPNPTITGHNQGYDAVWRPGPAGTGVVEGVASGDASVSTSDSGSTSSGGDIFSQLSSAVGGFFSEFGSRALKGDFSNTNYDSVFSSDSGASSTDTGGTSSTGTGTDNLTQTTESKDGKSMYVPEGYGSKHTYMGWGTIKKPSTDWTHSQYSLKSATEKYDPDGFGKVGDRYAVAMKNYYGSVGDYLNITQKDGTVYKVALADIKSTENGSTGIAKYVHSAGDIVEFVVNQDKWYSKDKGGNADKMHDNPGTATCKPEFGQNIAKIEKVGNYWTNDAGKSGGKGGGFGSGSISNKSSIANNASLSRRDRYKLTKALEKSKGGFGSTVEYNNKNSVQHKNSNNQYSSATRAQDYIKTTKDSSVNQLLMNAIEVLAEIAGNTSDASHKLNALKDLSMINNSATNNNIVVSSGNSGKAKTANTPKNKSNSKADLTARQIARGGY